MISEANQKAIQAAGLSFILGMKIPHVPLRRPGVARAAPGRGHPGRAGVRPALAAGPTSKRRDQMICCQYRAGRTLRGIDEQVAKAAKAVAGLAPVKRNRFIALDGAVKSVSRALEAKARDLAGLKGYHTSAAGNGQDCGASNQYRGVEPDGPITTRTGQGTAASASRPRICANTRGPPSSSATWPSMYGASSPCRGT